MIILWITKHKDKAGKTAPARNGDPAPETAPDVKEMLSGQGELAPVHVARLNKHTHN